MIKFNLLAPSLSRRIGAALVLVFVTGMIAVAGYLYLDTHGSHEAIQERTLQEQARQFKALPGSGAPNAAVSLAPDWQRVYAARNSGFYYTIYDRLGRVVSRSHNLADREPLPLTDAVARSGDFGPVHFIGPDAIPALTSRLRDGRFLVVARKPLDREAFSESLIEERSEPLWIFLPFGLIAFLMIVVVTRHTLRPIQAASTQAAKIGPGSLETRIAIPNMPAELRPLVDAFNHALDRLTEAYSIEKRITANAAHELRTPLTVLGLRMQRAKLGNAPIEWASVEGDLNRMNRLVSQLLDLARKESSEVLAQTTVNLARIAREAAASMLPLVEAQQRALIVEASEPVSSQGSADDLHDMIRNLIENALHHGHGTIKVKVSRSSSSAGEAGLIAVSDEGNTAPANEHTLWFDRFQTGKSGSSGSGLGLAIVKQVALAHGGFVQLLPLQHTTFQVTLPIRS